MIEAPFRRRFCQQLRRVAVGLALLAHASPSAAQSSFSLGSSAADVRRAQGTPTVIERLHSLGLEIWTFGVASVRLSSDSMRVIGWEDAGRSLRAVMRPGPNATTSPTFGAGSHEDDVVRLMGTPTAVREDRTHGTMLWRYGASAVTISLTDRRVVGWVNPGSNLRVVHQPVGPGTAASTPNASGEHARSRSTAPATLAATLGFREPSGNGALDGGETATLFVELRNRGPGTAYGLHIGVTSDSGDATLIVAPATTLARLDAGATARVDVPIGAPISVRDGHATLRLVVQEANGFDLDVPRRLTIPVRAARPARLAVAGVRADDQSGDGRISVRELVEVTARVWNAGPGVARDVKGALSTGDDAFLIEETSRHVTLGTMAPGEHRDVSFVFYTNTRARDVRVVLALTEASGQFGATLTLPFTVDRAMPQTLDATIADGVVADSAPRAPASVLDEIERDLPRAAEPNPDALVVILGVERYGTLPSARFAARDAQLFRRYAAMTFGVPDDRNHIYLRTDADATGNEFRKLFGDDGWLARRVQPSTDVYVFFSGHGAPDIKTRTPYLLPADADASYPRETGYALRTLYEQLARLDARSVTVLLDACFTGSTRSSATLFSGARPIVISVEHPALLRDNFTVIAASRGDQIASDYPAKRHGLFTYFALMGLRGAADADADRTVTVAELEQYLRREVPRAASSLDREQTPVVISRNKDRAIVRLGGTP